jgi:hypothetical protein
MSVLVIVRMIDGTRLAADVELGRGDACAPDFFRPDRVAIDGERAERAPEIVERQARVDEPTEDHVARRTREAVEVENRQT